MGNKASQGQAVEHSIKHEKKHSKEFTGGRYGHDHDRNQGSSQIEEHKVEEHHVEEHHVEEHPESENHKKEKHEKHIEVHGIWGGPPYPMHS